MIVLCAVSHVLLELPNGGVSLRCAASLGRLLRPAHLVQLALDVQHAAHHKEQEDAAAQEHAAAVSDMEALEGSV